MYNRNKLYNTNYNIITELKDQTFKYIISIKCSWYLALFGPQAATRERYVQIMETEVSATPNGKVQFHS